MPRIYNWTKQSRKVYQNDADPDVTLRLLNMTETQEVGHGRHQWTVAIFTDGEFDHVVVDELDGFNPARRAAADWMRTHPVAVSEVSS